MINQNNRTKFQTKVFNHPANGIFPHQLENVINVLLFCFLSFINLSNYTWFEVVQLKRRSYFCTWRDDCIENFNLHVNKMDILWFFLTTLPLVASNCNILSISAKLFVILKLMQLQIYTSCNFWYKHVCFKKQVL